MSEADREPASASPDFSDSYYSHVKDLVEGRISIARQTLNASLLERLEHVKEMPDDVKNEITDARKHIKDEIARLVTDKRTPGANVQKIDGGEAQEKREQRRRQPEKH